MAGKIYHYERADGAMLRSARAFKFFLWLAVIIACTGMGAKIFDLGVLATAWGASPPESLKLMPYGPQYPIDPGDLFIPISLLLLISYLGTLIAGWRSDFKFKALLVIPVIMIIILAVITPTVFWPMIRELYGAGRGTIERSQADLIYLVRKWWILDILRTLLIVISGFCHFVALNRLSRSGFLLGP